MLLPFTNEPYSDFTVEENLAAYRHALDTVRAQLGKHYPLVIGGATVDTDETIESYDPANPSVLVGTVALGSVELADRALDTAWDAYQTWSSMSGEARARTIAKLAAVLRGRKYELAAWQTVEASKNYAEAEADVAEAIDFCEYYARQAISVTHPLSVTAFPGEDNESHLVPLGAGVVIPPWNFPLAILTGMTIGPVAAGNTVVVKPAEQTPVMGWHFMAAVDEAGFPPGVINLVQAPGLPVGEALVDHPRTRFINFTGSKDVGLRIAGRAARVHPGQRWMKRAHTEMGGKDAQVVDETADIDAAARAAVAGAFGFQGQKCSACSRLVLVDAIHDETLDKVLGYTSELSLGPAADNHDVSAVITADQQKMILDEIEKGKAEAKLLIGGSAIDHQGGYFIEPTIFSDVDPTTRLAQFEIFGPVLSAIRAKDFDHALEIANATPYGLTGGLFSSRRDRIERARREFHVGNLYINRKITGALVGVQPFGGFQMSGTNAKAGGPDYLRLFMEMKTVAERLL